MLRNPSAQIQDPEKSQNPDSKTQTNPKSQAGSGLFLEFGSWCLGLGVFPLLFVFARKLAVQRRQAHSQRQGRLFLVAAALLERASQMRVLLLA